MEQYGLASELGWLYLSIINIPECKIRRFPVNQRMDTIHKGRRSRPPGYLWVCQHSNQYGYYDQQCQCCPIHSKYLQLYFCPSKPIPKAVAVPTPASIRFLECEILCLIRPHVRETLGAIIRVADDEFRFSRQWEIVQTVMPCRVSSGLIARH